jgi:hypothetical protein
MLFPFVSMAALGRHCVYGIWSEQRGALVGINYYVAYMFLVLGIKRCPVLVYHSRGRAYCEDSTNCIFYVQSIEELLLRVAHTRRAVILVDLLTV